MKVSAVVISHGHADELEQSLPALAPQVDELLVIANIPGSVPAAAAGGRARARERRAALVRREREPRRRADRARARADRQPGRRARAGRGRDPARLHGRASRAAGVAGPKMLYSDGTWQASRRSFPTVGATLVRRTPLRLLFPPLRWQRRHYLLDERPDEPAPADTMLGAFLLLRRTMLDEIGGWDAGFRMYCEDIDLNYRAAQAGWERWYVPAAVVRHEYAAVIDKRFLTRHTLWHARAMLRFLRKHPERLLALR